MTRPLRIEIENGIYHVTSRGWERRVIVRDDHDRDQWDQLLGRVANRFGWRFFAWALMDNHFHLFFQTPDANLSAGMHDLNSGYATCFNRRHRRVGSLFQGRFKAILVEDESYCLTLSRYIHLNPVRAGIVARPEEHRWSSYRHYLNSRQAPSWLDWRSVFSDLAKDRRRARSAYQKFVEEGLQGKITSPLKGVVDKTLLGSAEWVERMQKVLGVDEVDANGSGHRPIGWRPSPERIEDVVAQDFGVPRSTLITKRLKGNDARSAAIYLIRKLTSISAVELARQYGGVTQAAISKTVSRAEDRCSQQRSWKLRLSRIENRLLSEE